MGQVVHLLHLLASDFAAFSCFFLIFAMMRGFVILGKQWKTQNMIKTCLQDAGRLDCEDHLKSKKNLTMPRADLLAAFEPCPTFSGGRVKADI